MENLTPAQFREMLKEAGVKHTVPASPRKFLTRPEVARMINVHPGALNRYKLPPADALLGERGMGWTEETIRAWHSSRARPRNAPRDLGDDTKAS